MDLNATIDIIIKDLTDIRDILDDLKCFHGVPPIEVELAKSKCRSVIEIITLMKGMEQKVSQSQTGDVIKQRIGLHHEPEKQPEQPAKSHEKQMESFEHRHEEPPEMIPDREPEPVTASTRIQDHAILADQFANRPESFNEKLGSMKHDDDVLEIIRTIPVTKLAEAIGINDKFLFIREIFNGDQETYEQVLGKIDTALNIEEAKTIILTYAGENRESDAVKQFMSILKRKFPSNE